MKKTLRRISGIIFFATFLAASGNMPENPAAMNRLIDLNPDSAARIFREQQLADDHHIRSAALLGLADLCFNASRFDSSLIYLSQIKSREFRDITWRISFYQLLSETRINLKDFTAAAESIRRGRNLCAGDKYSVDAARFNMLDSRIYFEKGEFEKGFALILNAAGILENAGEQEYLAIAYNDLAVELTRQDLPDDAERYLMEAIRINAEHNNDSRLSTNYTNLGINFYNQKKYGQALSAYDSSLAYGNMTGDSARVLMNRANVHKNMMLWDAAEKDFLESLAISRRLGLNVGILYNYINLSGLMNRQNRFREGLNYAKAAADELGDSPRPSLRQTISYNLSTAWEGLERPDSALKYLKMYHALKDSLYTAETHQQILELKETYALERKERELLLMTSRVSNIRRNSIILLLGALLIISFVWQRNMISRNRLKALALEKDRIEVENRKNLAALDEQTMQMKEHGRLVKQLNSKLRLSLTDGRSADQMQSVVRQVLDIEEGSRRQYFVQRFQDVYPDFQKRLRDLHPSITANDLYLAMLIKTDLSSKEIAYINSRSIRTVESARLRLRKKMGLSPEENLDAYIKTLQ